MSRSFKKNAILKDGGKSHKYEKKLSSSKIRAKVHTILTTTDDYENMLFPNARAKDIINAYNICDRKDSPIYNSSWAYPYFWVDLWGKLNVFKYSAADIRNYKNK